MTTRRAAPRELVERYLAAYNARDVPGMLALLDPDVEFRNEVNGVVDCSTRGIAEFERLAVRSAALFTARSQRITGFASEGERATIRVEFRAVLARDLPGLGGRGDAVRLAGRSEFTFRDGRIASIVDAR